MFFGIGFYCVRVPGRLSECEHIVLIRNIYRISCTHGNQQQMDKTNNWRMKTERKRTRKKI